jgi:hypothetical protein
MRKKLKRHVIFFKKESLDLQVNCVALKNLWENILVEFTRLSLKKCG